MADISNLLKLAKAAQAEDGLINLSTITPSVLLRKEVFDQIFPKWTDEVKGVSPDGVPFVIRSIVLDGVLFQCVSYEADDGVGG